jgi:hypothetical protein
MTATMQTEFPFVLPRGYVDDEGNLHREGVMRLATAADEIHPLRDSRVQANPAYLVVIVLARVVSRLGTLDEVHPGVVERLFASDLAYLQELYNRINGDGSATVKAVCPACEHAFEVEVIALGGD